MSHFPQNYQSCLFTSTRPIFMKFQCNQSDLGSNISTKLDQKATYSYQDISRKSGIDIHRDRQTDKELKFRGATVS